MCPEHLCPIGEAVGERLGLPHRVAKLLVLEARPDPPTAGHCEEPHLAIARLAPEELEHGLRIGTGQPFGFGHGRSQSGIRVPQFRKATGCIAVNSMTRTSVSGAPSPTLAWQNARPGASPRTSG